MSTLIRKKGRPMNCLFRCLPIACLLSVLLLNHAVAAVSAVVTYPAPSGELASADYALEANGKQVFVYRADVLHGGPASFASFDFSGTVQVAVTSQRAVRSVKIRPISAGITPTVQNNTIRFELSRPGQLTVELNDAIDQPLHLFANPVEADTPRPDDPHVLYFGPGVHEVGTTRVRSNTTVYLAGGAIVRGIIRPDEKPVGESFAKKKTYMPIFLIEDAENVSIRGRGIIDMSRLDWHSKSPVVVQRSSNVRVAGLTIKDSPSWAVALFGSRHVTVSNVKQICHRENSDGIDIVNSQEVAVEDCFLRNNDDEICVKTTSPPPAMEARNISVRRCVVWNDRAYALGVTYETRCNVTNVLFADCDVIHDLGIASLAVHVSDSGTVSSLRFENIRLEDVKNRAVRLWIGKDMWGHDSQRGHIRGVVFKDVSLVGGSAPQWELTGHDADHRVTDVVFENLRLLDKVIAATGEARFVVNAYVDNLRFGATSRDR
jgi:hypothetical protein